MIEVKEEPPTATSLNTKNDMLWGIDDEVLKEIFAIDPSFTKNPYSLSVLASLLNSNMPGAKDMLQLFSRFGKTITLVYDPKAEASQYVNGYKDILGNVIVLKSINLDDILEEFFHAYWATCFGRNGIIPTHLRLNAELDAKIYVSFVRSAAVSGSIDGPIIGYPNAANLFITHMRGATMGYYEPGGDKIIYDMSEDLYKKYYDAFAMDVKDTIYSDFVGRREYTNGISAIFDLLNNR